jgi:hypothetical protein
VHLLNNVSRSIRAVLKPAGFANSQGILSAGYTKDATDPAWKDDSAFKERDSFMDQYFPAGDKTDGGTVTTYSVAQTLVAVLKQCGDDLTRENVLANVRDLRIGMLLPGITINTGAHRLCADQADANGAFRRRALGDVRAGPDRPGQQRELTAYLEPHVGSGCRHEP